jgi:hypothetical protein
MRPTRGHGGTPPLCPHLLAAIETRRDSGQLAELEDPDGDQGSSPVEEPLEEVRPPLVANAEATAAAQPGKRTLDHPTMPSL